MELTAYFDRIGYSGPREPGLATLDAVMRAHIAAVPFENIDVQLGRSLGTGIEAAFDKIVARRRGGWCFEQNGVLGWALAAMGFDTRRLTCGVMRAAAGDAALGNHLALAATIDGKTWLVDAGFGGSLEGPVPLAEGRHAHAPYAIEITRPDPDHWRFAEVIGDSAPFGFDIVAGAADEALFAARCSDLQTLPESPFVQNLVVQQRQGDMHLSLRGRVLSERRASGETRRLIESGDDLVETIRARFGLDVPETAGLWPRICARHAELFPESTDA